MGFLYSGHVRNERRYKAVNFFGVISSLLTRADEASSTFSLKVKNNDVYPAKQKIGYTVEPRLSGPRLSELFDYPDFFSSPVFFLNINKL